MAAPIDTVRTAANVQDNARQTTKKDPGEASAPGTDSAAPTPGADGDLGHLRQAVEQSDGMDHERVEALRDAIANGEYALDSERIAEAVLAFENDLERDG